MLYAYVLEIQPDEGDRTNTKLFQLINDLEIPEDQIYIDSLREPREELQKLVDILSDSDMLVIRSALDMGEDINDVYLELFPTLQKKGVELFSCEEPFFCGMEYARTLDQMMKFLFFFSEKRKRHGYQKALEEGRVGRPPKTEAVEKAIKLYKTKNYTIVQIEKLTGISKSTLYKYLKDDCDDKEE